MAAGHGAVSPGDLLAGAARPAGTPVRRWAEREALRQLAQPGCPACGAAGAAEERFAHSFVVELYADFRFQDRLARSAGFCPRHTRRLLVRREAPWVMPPAYRPVVEEAAQGLARSHGRAVAPAPCPACERVAGAEQGAIRVLLWALTEAEIGEAYRRHGGLCLRHVVSALAEVGDGVVVGLLLDVALERFGSPSAGPSLTDLAGVDPDAPLRAGARRALAASAGAWRWRTTIGGLKARLRSGACAICCHRCTACRVSTEAEAREQALLAAAIEEPSLRSCYRRSLGLCVRHAREVEAYGPRSAWVWETVAGRLRVLGWELEEASRKAAWAARHEPRGPEATAWLRAAGQLDGRVFLGGRPNRVARAWGVLAAGPEAADGPAGPKTPP